MLEIGKKILEKSVDCLNDASLDKLEDNNQKKKENDGDFMSKNKDNILPEGNKAN